MRASLSKVLALSDRRCDRFINTPLPVSVSSHLMVNLKIVGVILSCIKYRQLAELALGKTHSIL